MAERVAPMAGDDKGAVIWEERAHTVDIFEKS